MVFVSASLSKSVPFSLLKVVSSASVSVSAPPFYLILGYPVVLILVTLPLYSGITLKCNSNTGESDWPRAFKSCDPYNIIGG